MPTKRFKIKPPLNPSLKDMPKNFKNIKDYISILLHLDLSLNCYTLGIIKLRNAITREIAAKTIINKEL